MGWVQQGNIRGPSGLRGLPPGFPWTLDGSTAASDPGAGKLRFNATYTEMYVSETNLEGVGASTFLNALSIGAILSIQNVEGLNYLATVTGWVDNGTWRTVGLAGAVASGALLAPGDRLALTLAPKGNTGSQGPQGVQGNQGPQGPAGAASTVAGPQGPQGPQGPAGAASTVAGPQGPAGAAGAAGAQGPKGDIGLTGESGNSEMAYAEITATQTKTNTAAYNAAGDITGLSVTVTGEGKAVEIEVQLTLQHTVANAVMGAWIKANGSTAVNPGGMIAGTQVGAAGTTRVLYFKRRFVLTNGVQYTFTTGVYSTSAGTSSVVATALIPAHIAVIRR